MASRFKPGEIGFSLTLGEPVLITGYDYRYDGFENNREGYMVLMAGWHSGPQWLGFEQVVTQEEAEGRVLRQIEDANDQLAYQQGIHHSKTMRLQNSLKRMRDPRVIEAIMTLKASLDQEEE